LNAENLDKELIEETISVIIKYDRDSEKVMEYLGVNAKERKEFGQKEVTGEKDHEGMYEMHRSTHKHAH
jgi:hypothetical protein